MLMCSNKSVFLKRILISAIALVVAMPCVVSADVLNSSPVNSRKLPTPWHVHDDRYTTDHDAVITISTDRHDLIVYLPDDLVGEVATPRFAGIDKLPVYAESSPTIWDGSGSNPYSYEAHNTVAEFYSGYCDRNGNLGQYARLGSGSVVWHIHSEVWSFYFTDEASVGRSKIADINRDGYVTALDAQLVLEYYLDHTVVGSTEDDICTWYDKKHKEELESENAAR